LPDAMDVREQKQVKHIPFCGAGIWEFEFADGVVCRMRIKPLVMRIIWVIEICRNVAMMNMTTIKGKQG
jgi:hypothetical protein